jgi:GTPase
LNKWDLLDDDIDRARLEQRVRHQLRGLDWAPVVRTSALTGRGVDRLLPAVAAAVDAHRTRLGTAEVNRVLADAQARRPHPRTSGRSVRVLYGVQAGVAPPTFVLFASARIETTYLRYLERVLRGGRWTGTPLRLEVRTRSKVPLDH